MKKFLPIVIIFLILALFFYFRLYEYLSFSSLKKNQDILMQWTKEHYLLTAMSFILIYIVASASSIPGAIFLTLAGGFLFGVVFGTVYVVISATLGAFILYLIVRFALAEWVNKKISGKLALMRNGFQENAFNYLLILRLIPIFPFWLVNIVPALLNVSWQNFISATFLGIIPGSLVYVALGNSLHQLFLTDKAPNLGIIFTPQILLPLIGLALLSIIPLLYKRWQLSRS